MLSPEITGYDIVFIIWMITLCVTMGMSYRAGKRDGYIEGSRARRYTERKVRRMR